MPSALQTNCRALFWAAVALAVTMALLPLPPHTPLDGFGDKAEHSLAFVAMSLLGAAGYCRLELPRLGERLSFLGALIELFQSIPALHRDSDVLDWLTDTAATAAALTTWALWRRWRAGTCAKSPRRWSERACRGVREPASSAGMNFDRRRTERRATARPAPSPNRTSGAGRRLRRRSLAMSAGLLVVCIVVATLALTDLAPLAQARPAPTAEQAGAAGNALTQLWPDGRAGAPSSIGFGPSQLDGLSALATEGLGRSRLDLAVRSGALSATASARLSIGRRWLNVRAATSSGGNGFPDVRLRVGALPLSARVSRQVLEVAR